MVKQAEKRRRGNRGNARRRSGEDQGDWKIKKPRISAISGGDQLVYEGHNSRVINFEEEGQTWYQYEESLQERYVSDAKKPNKGNAAETVSFYRKFADDIYRSEALCAANSSNDRWVESTIRKGTLKDRIAAMSLMVSQDPLHKFHALDGLLQMAGGSSETGGQANSRVAQLAAEALQDLFVNTLLPADRKLKTLDQRALPAIDVENLGKKTPSKTLSPRILLLWRFEEMVKDKYNMFVRNYLGRTLRDNGLETTKISAIRTSSALLRSVPEGEAQILALIVNKLGDPQRKTAAAAGHELRAVLKTHPNMQMVIAREVQQLAFRPHLSPRALYNCVAFLNQLKLVVATKETPTGKESLPTVLINTYFKLFEVAIRSSDDRAGNNKVSAKSRLLQALLIGVNRAHPYLPKQDQHMDGHIDELYRVLHTSPAGAATQALTLLFHIAVSSPTTKDRVQASDTSEKSRDRENRYYRALFAALSGTTLCSHGKHSTMLFNIVFKSLKYDRDSHRVVACAKRLLSTTMHCSAPVFAASIFVLNEVAGHQQELKAYLDQLPEEDGGKLILHPTKREPRIAIVAHGEEKSAGMSFGNRESIKPPAWELSLASQHYHPSVSKFASNAGIIKYSGNPMQDFSFALFLDKFAYKNPRAVKDRTTRAGGAGQRRTLRHEALGLPVNDRRFLKGRDTAVQDEFFRKFFAERATRVAPRDERKSNALDEDGALDLAESNDVDHFGSFEAKWESDSDEEAFVGKLAEKLLVDSTGGAPVDIDDDPDFGDWGNSSDDDADDRILHDESDASDDASDAGTDSSSS